MGALLPCGQQASTLNHHRHLAPLGPGLTPLFSDRHQNLSVQLYPPPLAMWSRALTPLSTWRSGLALPALDHKGLPLACPGTLQTLSMRNYAAWSAPRYSFQGQAHNSSTQGVAADHVTTSWSKRKRNRGRRRRVMLRLKRPKFQRHPHLPSRLRILHLRSLLPLASRDLLLPPSRPASLVPKPTRSTWLCHRCLE